MTEEYLQCEYDPEEFEQVQNNCLNMIYMGIQTYLHIDVLEQENPESTVEYFKSEIGSMVREAMESMEWDEERELYIFDDTLIDKYTICRDFDQHCERVQEKQKEFENHLIKDEEND